MVLTRLEPSNELYDLPSAPKLLKAKGLMNEMGALKILQLNFVKCVFLQN